MGWGRYLLLGDFGQQMDLADHEAEIENLKRELRSKQRASATIEQRLDTLQRESDELKLYLAAVMRLLVAKRLATANEIKAVVAAVDREDGVADNRFTGTMLPEA
jgi:proline dehydrogenase